MSATPIPRTLAIILYGDLDISVIDELPANRLPIKNCVVDTSYRPTAYRFMQKQVAEGRQCYVICPMVEESEAMDAENVLDYAQLLQSEMGDKIRIAALHGRMKQAEKDEIMGAFAKNEIQVLVSTTVIEVGINVPNATVIMVENAERFGLAQLHQLRGRVGRGRHQSYCIFMSGSKTKETKKPLLARQVGHLDGGAAAGLRVYALYKGADKLLMATLEFLHHLVALAVTDALTDDVSCGLRCHTAKLFCLALPYPWR